MRFVSKTEGAFHTFYMDKAADLFRDALADADLKAPHIRAMSNYTGNFHDDDIDSIRESLYFQLKHPVLWNDNLVNAYAEGIGQIYEFGGGIGSGEAHEKRPNLEGMIKKGDAGGRARMQFMSRSSMRRRLLRQQRPEASQGHPRPFTEYRLARFIVTRYDKSMTETTKSRGGPGKADAKTAAERMREYRKRKRKAGLKLVRRWETVDDERARPFSDHSILDARSLAMHCRIALKITHRPKLLDKAKANLARWVGNSEGQPPMYLREWQEILDRPWLEIATLITSMSEEATRLRSSSPFAGILTADEREEIYAAFRA